MTNPEPEGAEPSNGILEPDSAATLDDLRKLAEEPFEPLPTAAQMVDEIVANMEAGLGPLVTPEMDYGPYQVATYAEIRERIERDKVAPPPAPSLTKRPPPRRASRRAAVPKEA